MGKKGQKQTDKMIWIDNNKHNNARKSIERIHNVSNWIHSKY